MVMQELKVQAKQANIETNFTEVRERWTPGI